MRVRRMLVAAVVAVLLSGCTGGGTPDTGSSVAAPGPTSPAATSALRATVLHGTSSDFSYCLRSRPRDVVNLLLLRVESTADVSALRVTARSGDGSDVPARKLTFFPTSRRVQPAMVTNIDALRRLVGSQPWQQRTGPAPSLDLPAGSRGALVLGLPLRTGEDAVVTQADLSFETDEGPQTVGVAIPRQEISMRTHC